MTRLLMATPDGLVALGGTAEGPAVGVIPGDDVALHRVRLEGTRAKARRAEAAALAAERAASPLEDLHVALGPTDADGGAWLGIVARERMEAHLDRFRAAGIEPEALVPAPLLLPPPDDGRPSAARLPPAVLVRGPTFAGALEEELAETLGADPAAAPPFLEGAFELAGPPALDLLQGPYAPRPAWWRARWFRLPAVLLLVSAAVLMAVPPILERVRAGVQARALDLATITLAERVLGTRPQTAEAAAAALVAARARLPESTIGERLAALLAELEPVAAARIESLEVTGDTLIVRLGGPPEAVNAVAARVARGPFLSRQAGDEIRIGARKAPPATLSPAAARLARAERDAAAVVRARRAGPDSATDRLARALGDAGLAAPVVAGPGGRASVAIPAVRPGVLLPILARLEAEGLVIVALAAQPNPDPSLNVSLEVR
ncbi:type II secretion system protein GspL [Thermaurantiacus sp.]